MIAPGTIGSRITMNNPCVWLCWIGIWRRTWERYLAHPRGRRGNWRLLQNSSWSHWVSWYNVCCAGALEARYRAQDSRVSAICPPWGTWGVRHQCKKTSRDSDGVNNHIGFMIGLLKRLSAKTSRVSEREEMGWGIGDRSRLEVQIAATSAHSVCSYQDLLFLVPDRLVNPEMRMPYCRRVQDHGFCGSSCCVPTP